jgi:hypothetical protein
MYLKGFMKTILDYKTVLDMTRDVDTLSVTLRRGKKGVGIFTTQNLKKGQVVAYYRFIAQYDNDYKSPTKNMYTIALYTPGGREITDLIGDIFCDSVIPPRRGIPFWGHFSNEPSPDEETNAFIDINTQENYANRSRLKVGDIVIYKLRASQDIPKGREVLWCYGDSYNRPYKANC